MVLKSEPSKETGKKSSGPKEKTIRLKGLTWRKQQQAKGKKPKPSEDFIMKGPATLRKRTNPIMAYIMAPKFVIGQSQKQSTAYIKNLTGVCKLIDAGKILTKKQAREALST